MRSGSHASGPDIPGVELLEVIGSGGSGVVYRGRQVAFDRDVAVKVAAPGAAGDGDVSTARWEREVAAIGRLSNHPNIVPVFDAGVTEGGAPYLVMAHVPRGTLGDRLREEGALSEAEVAEIGAKLASTLATVHEAGVLHRDIKPDNVLWSPHGEPQLSDFGIASLQDRATTTGTAVSATIAYAAPEVLAGEPATVASDVYGLGATLYACLTGHAPHPSDGTEHVGALVARVLEREPEPLRASGVDPGLAHVVERAIARRPEDRQADAHRLRHELDRARESLGAAAPLTAGATQVLPDTERTGRLSEPPVAAGAPGPAREATDPPREDRRNRTLWLAVLAIVVLAGGLLVVASMTDGGDQTATDLETEATEAPVTTVPDEPEATEAPTTTATPPTTEAPTTTAATTTTTAPATAADGGAGDTALDYVRTLARGDFDSAWAMTTPRFQNSQSRSSWEAFWGGHDVEVIGEPRVNGGTVVVPLRFDGQREDYRIDLVQRGDRWLIDGPVGS